MTKEEAASILEYPVYKWSMDWDDRTDGLSYTEAIETAIKVLKRGRDMKCKFEHDDDCCNCGSPQYMRKCKPGICSSAVLMTNADRIRAMSDEELAQFLDDTQRMECESLHILESDGTLRFESLKNGWLVWLQQPAEEGD